MTASGQSEQKPWEIAMRANPKNLRLHRLAEEDALVQTDDGDGIFAPANRDPDGQGHNEFTQTNLVSDGFVPAAKAGNTQNAGNEVRTEVQVLLAASEHRGIGSSVSQFVRELHGVTPGVANAQGAGGQLTVTRDQAGSPFELVSKIVVTSTRDVANPNILREAVFGSEVYLIDPDNAAHAQRLTNNNTSDAGGSLSPDGTQLLFASGEFRADPAVRSTWFLSDTFVMELTPHVYSADATGPFDIERTWLMRGDSPTWSPDSQDIVFHASASYWASGGLVTGLPLRDDPGAATTDSDLFLANVDDLAAAPDVPSKTQFVTNLTNTPSIIEDDAD
jgi:WD40-like Beta Propeller Repeat